MRSGASRIFLATPSRRNTCKMRRSQSNLRAFSRVAWGFSQHQLTLRIPSYHQSLDSAEATIVSSHRVILKLTLHRGLTRLATIGPLIAWVTFTMSLRLPSHRAKGTTHLTSSTCPATTSNNRRSRQPRCRTRCPW